MTHYQIPLADYEQALIDAADAGYRAHLVNDFVMSPDGAFVLPRVTFVKESQCTYRERRNITGNE